MSTSTRERIIAYLGQGIQQSIVATSCGVTPSYISQLLELEDVRLEVAKLRAGHLESAIEVDTSIERLERAALRQVESKLPFVKTAMEATRIFTALNSAKKKTSATDQNSDAVAAQQVTITVPRTAAIHFKLNETNQVIEVEGRTMAPLPSKALPELQKRRAAALELNGVATIVEAKEVREVRAVDYIAEHREKVAAADASRATGILRDLTMHMNGVAVVL